MSQAIRKESDIWRISVERTFFIFSGECSSILLWVSTLRRCRGHRIIRLCHEGHEYKRTVCQDPPTEFSDLSCLKWRFVRWKGDNGVSGTNRGTYDSRWAPDGHCYRHRAPIDGSHLFVVVDSYSRTTSKVYYKESNTKVNFHERKTRKSCRKMP